MSVVIFQNVNVVNSVRKKCAECRVACKSIGGWM